MDLFKLCVECQRLTSATLIPVDKRNVTFEYTPVTPPSKEHDCWLFSDKTRASVSSENTTPEPISLPEVIHTLRFTGGASFLAGHEQSLKSAYAAKDCHLCNLICSKTDISTVELGNSNESHQVIGLPTLQMIAPKKTWDTAVITRDPSRASAYPDAQLLFSVVFIRKNTGTILSETALNVSSNNTDTAFIPSSERVAGFRVQTINKIQDWLHECQTHAECQQGRLKPAKDSFWLPTRLLEVIGTGDGTQLRLIRTAKTYKGDHRPQYATLSHTWGSKGPPIWLTTASHYYFVSRIPPDKTPATFKQAAILCALLGIKYLWIDALCIVQDSVAEWEYESSRMFDVYSEAVLNIAATASTDSRQGLLVQNYHLTPVHLTVSWASSGALSNIRLGSSTSDNWFAISRAPLNSRGWVFQERLLSNRIVHFARDQVWLECRRSLQSEIPTSGVSKTPDSVSLYRWFKRGAWTILIMEYCKTSLSKPGDRLAAFAGIAEAFTDLHEYDPSNYVAGFLLPDILPQLTWFCESPSGHCTDVAPTWSWASLLARIKFFDAWQLSSSAQSNSPGPYTQEWHPLLQVTEVCLKSDSENPRRHLRKGFMTMNAGLSVARLIDIQILSDSSAILDSSHAFKAHGYWVDIVRTGGETYERNSFFDDPPSKVPQVHDPGKMLFRVLWDGPEPRTLVHLVPMQRFLSNLDGAHAIGWPAQTDIYTALILRGTPEMKFVFRRLGLMIFSHPCGKTPIWASVSKKQYKRPEGENYLPRYIGGLQTFCVV